MEVGGWVQVSPGIFFRKSSQNSSKSVLIICGVVYHMYSVCTFIKVVSYYDLSVLSMSVMCFPKNQVWMGVGRWGEVYPSFFRIFELF